MQNIQWCPFSDKHIEYINDALDCKMSVAEGSVRAGKTIDNSQGYSPENCRWATYKTQNNNRSNVKKYKFGIEYLTISEICEKLNINPKKLYNMSRRKNIPMQEVINYVNFWCD